MRRMQNPELASLMLFAHPCRLKPDVKVLADIPAEKGKGKGKRSPSREERVPPVELVPRESIRPTSHIHTHVHTCIRTYVHITYVHYIQKYVRTYMHTYIHTYIHA